MLNETSDSLVPTDNRELEKPFLGSTILLFGETLPALGFDTRPTARAMQRLNRAWKSALFERDREACEQILVEAELLVEVGYP